MIKTSWQDSICDPHQNTSHICILAYPLDGVVCDMGLDPSNEFDVSTSLKSSNVFSAWMNLVKVVLLTCLTRFVPSDIKIM